VTQDVYKSVLDSEPGPSPSGPIPYTIRAAMIAGLAVSEADRLGSERVGLEHLLLGVIREAERWDQDHAWGPQHLRNAAIRAGHSVDEIESALMSAVGQGPT